MIGTELSSEEYTYGNASWGDQLTAIGSAPIAYDKSGNPTTYNGYDLTWHGRQLKEMSRNGGQSLLKFKYNADGIRTNKIVNGVDHVYTLNGTQIVSESWSTHLVVYLYDESGSPIGLQYRAKSYAAYTFDTFYFEKNLQGDIIAVYNESGEKIGSYTHDAWGNCTVNVVSGNTTLETNIVRTYNPFRYRGYYYNTETQLYYLQSRYYNPAWGRFLNADGLIYTGTGLLGYNMYAYCNNNPATLIDSTGKGPITFILGCIAILAIACSVSSCGQTSQFDSDDNNNEDDDKDSYYKSYVKARDTTIQMIYEMGKATGQEWGATIYVHRYGTHEYPFRVTEPYTNNHSGKVTFQDPYGEAGDWIAIASVHYHPSAGDSTTTSWDDEQVAKNREIAMYVINSYGAEWSFTIKLEERTDNLPYGIRNGGLIMKGACDQ